MNNLYYHILSQLELQNNVVIRFDIFFKIDQASQTTIKKIKLIYCLITYYFKYF